MIRYKRYCISLFVGLVVLGWGIFNPIHSDIYTWKDKKGVTHFSDTHVDEDADKDILPSVKADPEDQKEKEKTLRVRIRNNQIIVPVTLKKSYRSVNTYLLLDTGATSTLIYMSIAEELGIEEADFGAVRVAGGGIVPVGSARIDSIKVGDRLLNWPKVTIIMNQGPEDGYYGLLGMDFLKKNNYIIDYKKGLIRWKD